MLSIHTSKHALQGHISRSFEILHHLTLLSNSSTPFSLWNFHPLDTFVYVDTSTFQRPMLKDFVLEALLDQWTEQGYRNVTDD